MNTSRNLLSTNRLPAGVTLIEVLITSALSTVLLAILYSSLDVASQVSSRAETRGTHDALARAVKKRIEWDIQNASRRPASTPLPLSSNDSSDAAMRATSIPTDKLPLVLGCADLLLIQTSPREHGVWQRANQGEQAEHTFHAYFVISPQSPRPLSQRLRDLDLTAGPLLAALQHTPGLHRYLLRVQAETQAAEIIQIDPDYQRLDFASLSVGFFDGLDWTLKCISASQAPHAVRCSLTIQSGNDPVGNARETSRDTSGIAHSQPRSTYAFTIAID